MTFSFLGDTLVCCDTVYGTFPFIWGGIGTFVNNLAVGLCREGIKVTVVTGYPFPIMLRVFAYTLFGIKWQLDGHTMKELSRVLVTGGAGFIGSHLVQNLIDKGFSVVVLDNFHSGKTENLIEISNKNRLKIIEGDIRESRALRKAMDDIYAIVHLAALTSVEESVKNPIETHDVNVSGTLNLLKQTANKNMKRFVYASSTAVYGDGNPLPLIENHPSKPLSPYAASKVSAECYCRVFHDCYGLDTVILRYFNVYGPRQPNGPYSGVITRFLQNALNGEPLIVYGDGMQTRDFIYVDDVVDATMLALENDSSNGETFNVCTGIPTTINELVQIVKNITETDSKVIYDKPRKGDIKTNYGDPSKVQDILGFKAKMNLEKGLKQLLDNFTHGKSITFGDMF